MCKKSSALSYPGRTGAVIEHLLRDVAKMEGTTVEEVKRKLDLLATDTGMTGEEWVTKVAEYIVGVERER